MDIKLRHVLNNFNSCKDFYIQNRKLHAKKCLKFCSSLLIPCSCCGHLCQKFKLADRKKCQEFEPKITQPFITFKTMFAIIFQISWMKIIFKARCLLVGQAKLVESKIYLNVLFTIVQYIAWNIWDLDFWIFGIFAGW